MANVCCVHESAICNSYHTLYMHGLSSQRCGHLLESGGVMASGQVDENDSQGLALRKRGQAHGIAGQVGFEIHVCNLRKYVVVNIMRQF